MSEAEHRRAMRVIRSFVVRYQSLPAAPRSWLVSTLRDFSQTGARFFCDRPFGVGEAMSLELVLPTSKEPVTLTARVVWAKPSRLGMTELGIEFTPPDERAASVITAAAAFFLVNKQEAA